jgi:hypothetical protein
MYGVKKLSATIVLKTKICMKYHKCDYTNLLCDQNQYFQIYLTCGDNLSNVKRRNIHNQEPQRNEKFGLMVRNLNIVMKL